MNIEEPGELVAYLRGKGAVGASEELEVCRLSGGVSNRTVLVRRENQQESWVIKQALSKLRVKADWFCSPDRIHREAAGLKLLSSLTPPGTIPKLVFEDRDSFLFAMEAVPDPHTNWKQLLLAGHLLEHHIVQFADLLATIHRKSAASGHQLEAEFGDLSYFEALRLEPYYTYTAECVPEAASFYEVLKDETHTNRLTLVHGDYSPKNILIYQERLVLLDHEVIHFGDPSFDLGFSLTHLLSKAHHLKSHRFAFANAAILYWRRYWSAVVSEKWSQGLEARAVRHTLGCLLSRVAGRSPLEYLSDSDCSRQRDVVVAMLESPPDRVEELVERFVIGLSGYA